MGKKKKIARKLRFQRRREGKKDEKNIHLGETTASFHNFGDFICFSVHFLFPTSSFNIINSICGPKFTNCGKTMGKTFLAFFLLSIFGCSMRSSIYFIGIFHWIAARFFYFVELII